MINSNVLEIFDKSTLIEAVNIFLKSFNDDFRIMQESYENKNYEICKYKAHKIKGAAASIGIEQISLIAHKIKSELESENYEIDLLFVKMNELIKKFNDYYNNEIL